MAGGSGYKFVPPADWRDKCINSRKHEFLVASHFSGLNFWGILCTYVYIYYPIHAIPTVYIKRRLI
jgi:hypothetical protein